MTGESKGRFAAITIYREDTGQIVVTCSRKPGLEDEACGQGEAWLPGKIDAAQFRVDPVTREPVPLMTFAPDLSAPNTVGGLPIGTTAWLQNIRVAVDDGSLEIGVTWPETVRVMLIHPLYLPVTIEVECA
jgi:hypothetical protein